MGKTGGKTEKFDSVRWSREAKKAVSEELRKRPLDSDAIEAAAKRLGAKVVYPSGGTPVQYEAAKA